MRLLVCGGRDYTDRANVFRVLDAVHTKKVVTAIIQGEARGADRLAADWGRARGVEVLSFPADWETHGKRAGPIRNQLMLDEGKPHGVVAFPGGIGTADMVDRSRRAGIVVWDLRQCPVN